MKKWHWIVLGALTVMTLIGQLLDHHYWWEAIPGFFAVFGFVGCLLLILGAKTLGNILVSRQPDYYEKLKNQEDVKTDAP